MSDRLEYLRNCTEEERLNEETQAEYLELEHRAEMEYKSPMGRYRVHTYQVFRVPYEVEADSVEDAARIVYEGVAVDPSLQPCAAPESADEWQPLMVVDPLLKGGEVDYEHVANVTSYGKDWAS